MGVAVGYRPTRSATDVVVIVVFGAGLLIGLAYAAVGTNSSTSAAAYTAHTYCTRDVPDVHSLWVDSPDAASQATNTMSRHAAGLGEPYASHAETLNALIAAARDARVNRGSVGAPIEAAVRNAWAQVMHDCRR